MKIMSFNLRFDGPWDGINAFSNRIPRVLETIEKESPDIIGFQEVTDSMRKTMREGLKGYTTIGCGRDRNYHGEAMLIGFKTELFELISVENVWLSETPKVPGTKYGLDHSGCPRMYTSILLKHNNIEKPFRFINTHLDHEGAQARALEATQLCNDISKYEEKFVLTGDFNAEPTEPEIKLITEKLSHRGCVDCTRELGPTFHNFGRLPAEKQVKIDYIFTDGICKNAYRVEDIPINGQYYSDHNAVCAEIEI
ncbi:MAG: endonuclease/exonuclease/phosphatase family protein [Ruminococcaceae bacterium]|nr:endonuclease/exonuclease/phosphatase family protein [Oscillospiraceae bacterium]